MPISERLQKQRATIDEHNKKALGIKDKGNSNIKAVDTNSQPFLLEDFNSESVVYDKEKLLKLIEAIKKGRPVSNRLREIGIYRDRGIPEPSMFSIVVGKNGIKIKS